VNFLFPQFLYGLFAIAIPVILHFFNLQKPKKILFPNVRFLKQVQENTSSKLKLKHLLILISRICFILFLVFTFAQPFIAVNSNFTTKGKPFVSIYLDNSFSMQNETGNESSLNESIKTIQQLLPLFPSVTNYSFLTNDFEGKDQFPRSKDKLNERLTEISFSNNFKTGKEISNKQQQALVEQGTDNKHVVWFSDFQKSAIGSLSDIDFDSTVNYYLVPIQNNESSNLFIDSIWLDQPLIKSGENNTLFAKVMNSGNAEIRDLNLKLFIDNVQVGSSNVDIKQNTYTIISFVFNVNGEGQKKASIRFEDYPIVFDNEYFLTLSVSPKISILHLFEQGEKYISNVYSNDNVFNITSNRIGDFNYSKIQESDIIILNGIKTFSSALVGSLKEFSTIGGSIVVFPSKDMDEVSYKKLADAFSIKNIEFEKSDTVDKLSYELMSPDYNNPFYNNVFEKKNKQINMPFATPVVRWNNVGDVLLKHKNGAPFLTMCNIGKGKLYLVNSPLDDKYSSFHKHSIFVPVMYKMALNSIISSERLNYTFQEDNIAIETEDLSENAIYKLEGLAHSSIPNQRKGAGKLIIDIPNEKMQPGFYDLKLENKTIKTIALNFDNGESKMDFYTREQLEKITESKNNVRLYDFKSENNFIDNFKQDNIGIQLWRYFLLGALMFLFIEILLIRYL